jgi:hypothetical protein
LFEGIGLLEKGGHDYTGRIVTQYKVVITKYKLNNL